MSGGVAYVWDPDGPFPALLNPEMVDLEECDEDDVAWLRARCWPGTWPRPGPRWPAGILAALAPRRRCAFVKVMPRDYKRVLEAMRAADAAGVPVPTRPSWRRPMGKPTGFLEAGPRAPAAPARCRCGSGTGRRSTSRSRPTACAPRPAGAWTAASRSATTAARSAT